MSRAHYCQEKQELAQILSEDEAISEKTRREMIRAAELWGELADQWLEIELRKNLLGGLPFKGP